MLKMTQLTGSGCQRHCRVLPPTRISAGGGSPQCKTQAASTGRAWPLRPLHRGHHPMSEDRQGSQGDWHGNSMAACLRYVCVPEASERLCTMYPRVFGSSHHRWEKEFKKLSDGVAGIYTVCLFSAQIYIISQSKRKM